MRSRKLRKYVMAAGTILMLVCAVRLAKAYDPYRQQEILFSEEDSFSKTDVTLELSTLRPSELYYTLDGSEPDREALRYEGGIYLEAEEECRAYPVRAIAFYQDGTASEICQKTYFVGENAAERFSTLVVSLTGEPEELFDYENGILVTGKLRDDYVLENPEAEITDRDPANYNLRGDEAERSVYVEIWEADGTPLAAQQLGVRVHGGLSRGSDVKSLRLIAREEYGAKRILSPLFLDAEEELEADRKPALYKRVVLRNHGNDQESGYLRNELAQELARDAGFPCTQRFRAASVWINGAYYGFEWLEEYYDETYFDLLYGTESEEGSWQTAVPYEEISEEAGEKERRAALDLDEVLTYAGQNLTDDRVFEELEEKLDVENFLRYCAIEIYLSNVDWPYNNCKAYRWYSDAEDYRGEGIDGKWRFALYDLDMAMGRVSEADAETHSLALALGAEESGWEQETPLLYAMLQREDLRQRFREIMEEYMEGALSPEYAEETLDGIREEMSGELTYQMLDFAQMDAEKAGESTELYYQYNQLVHEEQIEIIQEFFQERPEVMREELSRLEEYLGV